jgi:succinate dehydrogenase hydrophobic anchor subunit
MSMRPAPKIGLHFDYVMWLFTRLSALAMYALAFIGIIGALWMGARTSMSLPDLLRWAFMPEATHVRSTNVTDLLAWRTLFWQIMGSLVVILASAHGLHGVLNVLEDYLSGVRLRQALRLVVLVIWLAICAIGIYVILIF